jgi:hypothetical protein
VYVISYLFFNVINIITCEKFLSTLSGLGKVDVVNDNIKAVEPCSDLLDTGMSNFSLSILAQKVAH